jgi:diguanylate cyclase (GGDEF)-like protein/PAS domain S-box-containing protein
MLRLKDRAWKAYLAFGLAGGLAYYLVPPAAKSGPFFNLLGASSVVAIIVGIRMHKPLRRLPWYLFATGQAFFIMGDVITYNYSRFFHQAIPFPSAGDVLYLCVYPCFIAGILLLIKQRSPGKDREGLIDSLIITIGAGLLSWEFLIAPYARDFSLSVLVKSVSIAYPLMDVLLLAVVVRLAVAGGRRGWAFYLLVVGSAAVLVTDAAYGMVQLSGVIYQNGGLLEAGWLSFYVLWAAAALHPSMRRLGETAPKESPRFSRLRLVLLAGASLMAPLILVIQLLRDEPLDVPVVVTGCVAVFMLTMLRMSGLVRKHERAEGRERALRQAGASLVAAADRAALYHAAIEATRDLLGPGCGVRLVWALDAPAAFRTVARRAPGPNGRTVTSESEFESDPPVLWSSFSAEVGEAFAVRGWAELMPIDDRLRQGLALKPEMVSVSLAPLYNKDELHGLLIVEATSAIPATTLEAVSALASQVALALESAVLAEDLSRRRSESRFASLVRNSSDVITIIDPDSIIRFQSPSIRHVLGYDPGALPGARLLDFVHPEDQGHLIRNLSSLDREADRAEVVEFRWRHTDGTWREVETLLSDLSLDPEVGGVVLNTRDVSERKAFERELAHQAFHDSITGLANRALFRDRVEHALVRQLRVDRMVAVLFMDLDDFKTVNDSLGHAAGDLILADVGRRVGGCVRDADTAARLGGDEFAILLEDADHAQAAEIAERVLKSLEAPMHVEGKEVFVRASIGIAVGDEDCKGAAGTEELLRNADVAMYMAKSQGKGRYQVFEPEMHSNVVKRLELKADLQRALEKSEFVLQYQPVVVLATGGISGVEALVRWRHPERGIVPPLDFIPLAEETGLIVGIGGWVLREACRQGVELQRRFPKDPALSMSVNLSARQLQHAELISEVRSALRASGLPPASLVLEITETAMMQDADMAILRLNELKEIGVRLAIDDFGTGYSSLNYLRSFPVDIVKIDRSFVMEIDRGGDQSVLTAGIVELAGSLRLRAVAEGIETAEQLEQLLAMGCEFGQGFYFARPLDLDALMIALERETPVVPAA